MLDEPERNSVKTMARLLYDFALAEGDRTLARLVLTHAGGAALEPPVRTRNEFAERAVERIARRLGLVRGPG
jgi:hypothetical protein